MESSVPSHPAACLHVGSGIFIAVDYHLVIPGRSIICIVVCLKVVNELLRIGDSLDPGGLQLSDERMGAGEDMVNMMRPGTGKNMVVEGGSCF